MDKFIKEKVNAHNSTDFFLVTLLGIGIGFLFTLPNDIVSYNVILSIGTTTMLVSFLIFLIPKIAALFYKTEEEKPIGQYLAIGRNGERPKIKQKAKLELIKPKF